MVMLKGQGRSFLRKIKGNSRSYVSSGKVLSFFVLVTLITISFVIITFVLCFLSTLIYIRTFQATFIFNVVTFFL